MNCNVLSLNYWVNYYTTNICNTSQLGSIFFTKLQKVNRISQSSAPDVETFSGHIYSVKSKPFKFNRHVNLYSNSCLSIPKFNTANKYEFLYQEFLCP